MNKETIESMIWIIENWELTSPIDKLQQENVISVLSKQLMKLCVEKEGEDG